VQKSWHNSAHREKRTRAKKRATPGAQPGAPEFSHCEHDVAVSCKGRGSEHPYT